MNRKTNMILTMCAIIMLTVSCVMGTLALLTDTDEVVNTFTVGKVAISLDEAAVNTDGTPIEGANRVQGNSYHMIPGNTYVKDPTVTVIAGSEPSYIRMFVSIDKADELKAIFGDDFLPEEYVSGWDKSLWPCTGIKEKDGVLTYEFRYHSIVDASDSDDDIVLDALFDSFTVPGEVRGEQLATIADMKITVVSHAMQSENFDDEEEAWKAFDNDSEDSGTN